MCVRVCICICINIRIRVQYLVRLWESRDLNMYMYRCVQLYLVPIPYDPNSVYMCLCLVSSKALGIEESEYVYIPQTKEGRLGGGSYFPSIEVPLPPRISRRRRLA